MSVSMSFIFYVFCFTVSSFFISFSEKLRNSKGKYIFLILGLCIPILIGTFRFEVGTDFKTYYSMFNYRGSLTVAQFISEYGFTEILFYLINRLSFIRGSFNLVLFIYSTGTIVFSYLGIRRLVSKDFLFISYFFYLLIFYIQTFNIMRQGLAIAIFLFATQYILTREPIKFFLWAVICILVHNSAAIVLFGYFFINNRGKIHKIRASIVMLAMVLFSVNYKTLIQLYSKASSIERYEGYLLSTAQGVNKDIIIKILFFLVVIILYQRIQNNTKYIILMASILSLILGFLGFSNPYLKRFGAYFDVYQVISVAYLGTILQKKEERLVYKYSLYVIVVVYAYLLYVYLGFSDVIPYNFEVI